MLRVANVHIFSIPRNVIYRKKMYCEKLYNQRTIGIQEIVPDTMRIPTLFHQSNDTYTRIRVRHLQMVIVFLSIVLTCITFTPIIGRIIHARQDPTRIEIYIHKYQNDYMQYLAGIVRGREGLFWYKNPFSVPKPEASTLYVFFPIIGMLSAPFNMPPPIAYHMARIILIFFTIYAAYTAALVILKNTRWALITTLLSIITTSPPTFFYSDYIAKTFKSWWDLLNAYERFDGLPHHLLARGLQYLSIAWYFKYRETSKLSALIVSVVLTTLCVFAVPQAIVPTVAIMGLYTAWDMYCVSKKTKKLIITLRAMTPLISLIVPAGTLTIMMHAMRSPLWIANRQWEVTYFGQDPFTNYHLYISFLFLFIPAYIGFVTFVKNKIFLPWALLGWILIPLLCSPLLPIIGIGGARFALEINIILPLSILATNGFYSMYRNSSLKIFALGYTAFLFLYFSMQTTLYAKAQWDFVMSENLSTRMYPPREYFELVDWVKKNVPKEHVILSSEEIGSLLVSHTPVFAYIGEQTHGSNWDLNIEPHNIFYGEHLSAQRALVWLRAHDVEYVVEDPKFLWPLRDLTYPFLVKKWQNSQLGIYEVQYPPSMEKLQTTK